MTFDPQLSKEELIELFEEEIRRKDKIIEKLKEENLILMKTALKKAEQRIDPNKQKRQDEAHNNKEGFHEEDTC